MRTSCLLLSQACLVLSLMTPVSLLQAQTLQVYTQAWPPYSYYIEGKLTGYSTELLQAVLQEAALDANYTLISWNRAYQHASTEANTLLYTTTRTPDRENLFEWIGPIGIRKLWLFKLKERTDIQIKDKEDLKKYKVSIVRDTSSLKLVMERGFFPREQIDEAPTTASNVKKLFFKRVDLILATNGGANYELSQLPYPKDAMEPVYLLNDEFLFYFAINKKTEPVIIEKIRHAFEKVRASGLIETLKKKYMID
ncbi:substrate-binding periplasmic protein [Undibacterium flavidum]|uniref:Transporter substrate-binding domain-containing protein n=1 Tax=Undibacterium flavidum TaxID=2762297 RepID=A0ABR6YCN6_9BURK|nr:ABC transporter substrate-binding protein [Undibacterium flavidum]MBC3874303.1 transporter substrate-binding domain-containing protein [Undibacterium flavidum]